MPIALMFRMILTTVLLFGFLFGIVAAVGYYFQFSMLLMIALSFALIVLQWLISPYIIWWTTNMRFIEKNEYPWLWKTVKELSKEYKIPMPRLALARIGGPNAFVFGRTPGSATLTVTQGLLNALNQSEVKAVVGHEMGHIRHKDMVVMTFVGAIPIIAYYIAQSFLYSSNREDRHGAIIIGIGAFLVYLVSNLLVLLMSRLREYYADDFGGRAVNPELLASALAKITYGLGMSKDKQGSSAVHSFYIVNPLTAAGEIARFPSEYSDMQLTDSEVQKAMEWEKKNPIARFMEIFQTHPLTFKRIRALEELGKEIGK